MKAVKFYIKYVLCAADTVRELGYPYRKMLARWYKEYKETGDLHKQFIRIPKYTPEQMKAAVDYYLEHGRNISRTAMTLRYPSREELAEWISELAPGTRKCALSAAQ